MSVETSPKTADRARLGVLRARGVDRVSIGVQSFVAEEAAAAGRPQTNDAVEAALENIRALGFTTLNIDGAGTIRRCHFIKTPIGNIYDPGFEAALRPRVCSNQTCGCHIGYVHMPELHLHTVFGDGLLERIPTAPIWLQNA